MRTSRIYQPHSRCIYKSVFHNNAEVQYNRYIRGTPTDITYTNYQAIDVAQFNGTTSKIVCDNPVVYNIRTISFWLYLNTLATDQYILAIAGTVAVPTVYIYVTAAGVLTATGFTGATRYVNGVTGTAITAGKWNKIVISCSSNNVMTFLTMGNNGANFLNGNIGNLIILNKPFGVAEVAVDYKNATRSDLACLTLPLPNFEYFPTVYGPNEKFSTSLTYSGAANIKKTAAVSALNLDGILTTTYVDCGNVMDMTQQSFSVAVWVKFRWASPYTIGQSIITKKSNIASGNTVGWSLHVSPAGGIQFRVSDGVTSTVAQVAALLSVTDGEFYWRLLVGTFSWGGLGNSVSTIYASSVSNSGMVATAGAGAILTDTSNAFNLRIGSPNTITNTQGRSLIGRIRIWKNVILTAEQIQQMYSSERYLYA